MAISGFNRDRFIATLREHVTASQPIRSIEHLRGREKELARIDQALQANGRHVFIYGDRGVGKSSLAATAATQFQSSDGLPISIGCGATTTFYGTIEAMVQAVMRNARGTRVDASHKINLFGVYSVEIAGKAREIEVPHIDSIYAAVEATRLVENIHSRSPVVVIDEFDQIADSAERALFASFLKNMGDAGVSAKLIFTGVGGSLNDLLGAHESSYRQLHSEKLERLYWDARKEIVENAAEAFGLEVDPELTHLIAKISNGFPYYVHLITEHLLWHVFNLPETIAELDQTLFDAALKEAIRGIAPQLQKPYDKATAHHSTDFRDIVWATADSESETRTTEAMFRSYLRVHRIIHGADPAEDALPLAQAVFTQRIGKLKDKNHGEILQAFLTRRRGVYVYRENMLKGFVAMKAYEGGVVLQGDVHDAPSTPTAKAKLRKFQAAKADWTPKGVKFRGERRSDDDENDV